VTGERVLIIGGDPDFVEFLLTRVLSPHGYRTQTAIDGKTGAQAAQETPPDIVLISLDLQNVSYADIFEQLKVTGPPPIIGFAPQGMEAAALNAFRMGVRDVLLQPIEAEEIAATIGHVLQQERVGKERDWLVRRLAGSNASLEETLHEAQTLYGIGKSIASNLDLHGALVAVVQAAVDLVQAQESHLLLTTQSHELFLRASRDLSGAATSTCIRIDDSVVLQVIRSGEPLVLSSKDRPAIQLGYRTVHNPQNPTMRSVVLVPLKIQNQCIGVLSAENVTHTQSFSQGDVDVLSALADWAAIALKNAQLHAHSDQTLSRVLGEIAATQHRTDLILQNITEGVFTVNTDCRITSVNRAAERITGWKESELLGQQFDDVLVPKTNGRPLENAQTIAGQALLTQSPVSASECTILCQDNRRIQVIATATPLRSADAMLSGALITIRDLSSGTTSSWEREKMLQTLHSQHLLLDHRTEEQLQSVSLSSDAVASDCHPVTLRPIISQAAKSFQRTNPGITFEVKLDPDLPFAVGNEGKIELALLNLIESILVLNDTAQPIVISANAAEDSVCIRVEGTQLDDTPAQQAQFGLEQDNLSASERLVSLWATPQVKLYIASKLIEAQGGRVWTEALSERSTCFNLSLPKIEVQDVVQALADR
jgi:PAS domain S-box-containing protein